MRGKIETSVASVSDINKYSVDSKGNSIKGILVKEAYGLGLLGYRNWEIRPYTEEVIKSMDERIENMDKQVYGVVLYRKILDLSEKKKKLPKIFFKGNMASGDDVERYSQDREGNKIRSFLMTCNSSDAADVIRKRAAENVASSEEVEMWGEEGKKETEKREKIDNVFSFVNDVAIKVSEPMDIFNGKNGLSNVLEAINFGYKTINNTSSIIKAIKCLDGMDYVYHEKIRQNTKNDDVLIDNIVLRTGMDLIKAYKITNDKFNLPKELWEEYKQNIIKVYKKILFVYTSKFVSKKITDMNSHEYKYLDKFARLMKDLSIMEFNGDAILLNIYNDNLKNWYGDSGNSIGENGEIKLWLVTKLREYKPCSGK